MSDSPQQSDDWTNCPEGVLTSLGHRLRVDEARDQSAQVMRSVVALGVLVVVGAGTAWWLTAPNLPGEITCAECHSHFAEYHGHLAGNATVDPDLATSMAHHLEVCGACRAKFKQQFPGALQAGLKDAGRWLSRSDVQLAWAIIRAG